MVENSPSRHCETHRAKDGQQSVCNFSRPLILSIDKSISELARRFGIQTSYIDTAGKRQLASRETIASILELWGVTARTPNQILEATLEHELHYWQKILEPVMVAWHGYTSNPAKLSLTPRFSGVSGRPTTGTNCLNSFPIVLRIPAGLENHFANCTLRLESGENKTFTVRLNALRATKRSTINGMSFVAKQFAFPPISLTHHASRITSALPHGYHHLDVEIAGRTATALIISAPKTTYSDRAASKCWGAFLPMYAAHSRESWGAGNFGDWQKLTEWVASLGSRVVSSLPLLAAFLDHPVCEPSPYSPASRLFWNEFYLDIPAIAEFSRCPATRKLFRSITFQRRLHSFRQSSLIDYQAQMAARRQVLEKLSRFFFETDSPRRKQFAHFLRAHPQVEDYAKFRAACDRTNLSWQQWPQRMRDGTLQRGDYSERDKNYHLYVQWLAHEQIAALTRNSRALYVQFYLDLPLGVHPAGYDLWRERDAFATAATVGAPPDAFFSKGQNWGFSPLHPQRLREQGYRYLRDVLQFHMRHTGMLRLDHVMSLHRLYWIPEGCSAKQGAYVSYPAKELYAILGLESHRHKTTIVGENLGTVPDEVNKAMNRHGLRRMYVIQFAQRQNSRAALAKPPPRSVASLNTHDMPTFAAHWCGLDIDDRIKLGLLTRAEARNEHVRRAKLNLSLVKFLRASGFINDDEEVLKIIQACLGWLVRSPADLVLINLEDLWAETLPQNLPGTSTERPNWRRKARLSLEEILSCPKLRRMLAVKKVPPDTRT